MKRVALILGFLAVLVFAWRVLGGAAARPVAGGTPAAPAAPAIPVGVAGVTRGSMEQELQITGGLRTDEDVRLGARIQGRVAAVHVKEGDRVRPGQRVVELDPTELQARVAKSDAALHSMRAKLSQAEHGAVVKNTTADAELQRAGAALAAARVRLAQAQSQASITETETQTQVQTAESRLTWANQRLSLLKEGARRQERRQAELAVQQARATLEDSRSRFERRRQLFRDGAIAGEEVDAAEKQFRIAEAQFHSAEEQLALLEEGTRGIELQMAEQEVRQAEEAVRQARANQARRTISQQDVETAQTGVRQAEAGLAVARAGLAQKKLTRDDIRSAAADVAKAAADLDYDREQLRATRIVSPVSGVVVARSVNPGETVSSGVTLLRIVAAGSAYFEGQVPERELSLLRVGQPVKATIDSVPGRTFAGFVEEIIPVADASSRLFRARVRVPSPGGLLPVGGFARGAIKVHERRGVLVVPKESLASEVGDVFVYVVQDGRARRHLVTVGLTDARNAEITSGLEAGQSIIVRGSMAVTDGARVVVKQ